MASTPTVRLGESAYQVWLAAGTHLEQDPQPGQTYGCAADAVALVAGDRRVATLVSFSATCPARGSVGNGRHGVYRAVTDIPAGTSDREQLRTPLGQAVLFTQRYREATGAEGHDRHPAATPPPEGYSPWTEPVAVITLTRPGTSDRPALAVYSDKGAWNREQLATFLRDRLRPAETSPTFSGGGHTTNTTAPR